ncbi:mitochondrial thiamine pyrophosphate transporter [Mortierella antarctica]|nr:mitochondrial thiamine pyrophosphate transporter [Mortierella antarctica]
MADSGFATIQGSASSVFVETVANTTSALTATPTNTSCITLDTPNTDTGIRAAPTAAAGTQHDRKSIAIGSPTLTKAETVFCGATAGVVSRFVIAPLDVVKIRLQGLWKGNMAAEYLYLTYGGMQFLIYQQTKSFLSRTADVSAQQAKMLNLTGYRAQGAQVFTAVTGSSSVQSFISGATAGIMATACTYPFDLLRTRFAVQRDVKVYTGVLQAFQHIFRKDGVQGFYRGMAPALIQVIPYMGVMFGSYDSLKQVASWLKTRAALETSKPTFTSAPASKATFSSTSDPPPQLKTVGRLLLGVEDMICGALSGLISKTAVYPLDMVRKRLQIQGSEQQKVNLGVFTSTSTSTAAAKSSMEALPTSVWSCMRQIVRREGYLALYKGLLPGLLKAAPASAVTFLVFSQAGAMVERVRRP